MTFKTEQEKFWAGEFGEKYIDRNKSKELLAANLALFANILTKTTDVYSFLEFGANIGMNIAALKLLKPNSEFSGVEINKKAASILEEIEQVEVYNQSILEFDNKKKKWDLVFTKGVLIHINPDELDAVYNKMYNASNKYIMVAEYYNPSPVSIEYRNEKDKLFKRDFAGELLKKYPDLKLIAYDFVYHNDQNFIQDDITWFLLKKEGEKYGN